ncbi:glycosyltransferase family 2 protein [Mycoavidus sp. B2-EB]|uniref:glycosyltransferase family 2 protein n=1 Tax=Mycoavidus sp. B2-EB TaxID=2651972 RepID=UPI0016298960|nr:glycosyltransferase family 2 protein [Mycoavidus sp. B2-EB]BBO60092.1 glycosyl transferase [Mycoavidus sp. B2-EB]
MHQPNKLAGDQTQLSVSVVTFKPDIVLLQRTLASLHRAIIYLRAQRGRALSVSVVLVDNGNGCISDAWESAFKRDAIECKVITGHGNVGYGRGHNLALECSTSDYHLILNPDVEMSENALAQALDFFDQHHDIALIAPHVLDEYGVTQYLCRCFPNLLDLFVRGFLRGKAQDLFASRLVRYELRDLVDTADQNLNAFISPQIISGCYMLFRMNVLKKLGGFDQRYFLYFEDYDLSLRASAIAGIAYVPAVRVIHFGGGASKKGWRHICMFTVSACRFFNRFGWRLI